MEDDDDNNRYTEERKSPNGYWDQDAYYLVKIDGAIFDQATNKQINFKGYSLLFWDNVNGYYPRTHVYKSLEKLAEGFLSAYKWRTNGELPLSTIPAPMVRGNPSFKGHIREVKEPASVEEMKKFIKIYIMQRNAKEKL